MDSTLSPSPLESAPPGKRRKWRSVAFALLIVTAAGVPLLLKFKEGSDRAGCIMNQRNIQQAVRAYSCVRGGASGDPFDKSMVIPDMLAEPYCPSGGTYIWSPTMPEVGTLAAHCSDPKHALPAEETANW